MTTQYKNHTIFNSKALVRRGKVTLAGYDQSWMDKQLKVTLLIPSEVREKKDRLYYMSTVLRVDYRQLNSKTEDDRQPIPRIQDSIVSA